jgi:hypothetical protein
MYVLVTDTVKHAELKPATPVSVKRYRSFFELGDPEKKALRQHSGSLLLLRFKEEFLRGSELWISRIDDEPAGVCWSCVGDRVGPYSVPPCSSDILICNSFTFPGFQERSVLTSMVRQMVTVLADEGARRVLLDCPNGSIACRQEILEAGFTELEAGTTFRWTGRGESQRPSRLA